MNKQYTTPEMRRSDETGIFSLQKELQSPLLSSILLYSPDGMAFIDQSFVVRAANRPFAEQLHVALSDIVGRNIEDAVPDWPNRFRPIYEDVRRTGEPFLAEAYPFEFRDQPERGTTYWEFVVSPVYGQEEAFLGYMVHNREVTARVRAEAEKARLLDELQRANGQLVAASTQLQERIQQADATTARLQAIQSITESALAHLKLDDLLGELLRRIRRLLSSDMAMILLLSPDGRYLQVRASQGIEELALPVLVPFGQGVAGRIAASRQPVIVDDLSTVEVINPVLRKKIKSLAGVPLIVEERVVGVLYVGTLQPRHYTQSDLELLELVADRAALAIDRSETFEAEQHERMAAEQAADRVSRLLDATTALLEVLNPDQVAEVAIGHAVTALNAAAGLMVLLAEDGNTLKVAASRGYPETLMRQLTSIPIDSPMPIAQAARTGQPIFLSSTKGLNQRYPNLPEADPAKEYQSFVAVPLTVGGRPAGATGLSFATQRDFSKVDRDFLNSGARQASIALERARLYEAERRARAEAETAVRVRDMFLSVASHELRTPITSLLGFSQVTLRRLDREEKPDIQRIRRALQVIQDQSRRLNRLVVQLLDISRLEAGRLELERESANVVKIVQDVVDATKASSPQADIVIHAPPEAMAFVDPGRLEQVLTNLLNNAIKFSPHGGLIEVNVSLPTPHTFQVAVRDHGIGIPTDRREGIFTPFYQAHGPSHTGGMGLGLYISKQIVNLHGGTIEVQFPPDGGTRFVVTLPTGLAETEMPSTPEETRA